MIFFMDNSQARAAIVDLLTNTAVTIPDDVRTGLMQDQSSASIVDAVVNAGERIYARREDLPKEAIELGAQLASFRQANDWHRYDNAANRAMTIKFAMMRDAGEPAPDGVTYADPKDDPAPIATYAPPADPATAPATPMPGTGS